MAYQFLSTILGINANFTGNLGVGTTTPGAKLDVSTNAGRLRITQNTAGNTLNGLEFVAYNGNVLGGLLFNQSTGEIRLNASSSYFPTIYSMGVEVVRIPTSGNVLIGTTTDGGYKLDVNGTTRFQGNSLVSLNQNAETSLVVSNTTSGTGSSAQIKTVSNGGGAQLGKYSPTTTAYKTIAASDGFLYNYGNGNLSILNDFGTGNINFTARGATTAQVIMNGASQPLALVGTSSNFSMNSGNDVYFYFNSQSANGRFYANPQPTVQYTYDQPQSVGFVGTLAGGSVWYGNMNGSGGAVKYNCSFNGGIHSHIWYYNFTEQMRLQYTGNLLIGTSTDSGYKLDVNGTGIFRNVLTGYVNSGSLVLGAAAANSQAITITGYYTSGGAISTTNSNARSYNLNMGGQSFGYSASYNGNSQAVSTTDSYFRAVGAINITAGTIALHGYNFSPTITSETNATIYAFSSTLNSASNHYDLYLSGGAKSYIAGNVLIGTTTDAGYKLDVNGDIRTQTGYIRGANSDADLRLDGTVGSQLRYGNQKVLLNSADAYIYTNNTARLYINNAGSVGIGTTSPSGLLDVSTGSVNITSYAYGLDLKLSLGGGFARANRIYNSLAPGLTSFFGAFGDSTSGVTRAYWTIGNQTDDTGFSYTSGIHLLYNGNVGIGTANPNGFATTGRTILSLNGASNTLIEFKVGDAFQNYIYSTTSTFELYSSSIIDFQSLGASRLRIASSGNVLIGTTTDNGGKLQVNGDAYFGTFLNANFRYSFIGSGQYNSYHTYIVNTNSSNGTYGLGVNNYNTSSDGYILGLSSAGIERFYVKNDGNVNASSLAGSGTRMVVADSTGTLSTQSIPGGGSSYGSWQDNNTQTATTNNTGYGIQFNTNNFNSGVTVIPDSLSALTLIKFANAGKYDIQFSFQFQNTSADDETVYIWIRKNGENTPDDVPDSNTIISIPKKHGSGTPGNTVAAWNLFVDAAANDFYQLVWATSNATDVTMQYYGATGFCPATPSAILTVNQVD